MSLDPLGVGPSAEGSPHIQPKVPRLAHHAQTEINLGAMSLRLSQSASEVFEQVLAVFQPDGKAHQVVPDAALESLLSEQRAVSHLWCG